MLGINTVKNLALSTAVLGNLGKKSNFQALNIDGFWRHSLCVGVTAKLIAASGASATRSPSRSTSSAGLLHDIGKIPLNNKLPTEYVEGLALTDREHMPLYLAEERTMEVNHCEVGRLIIKSWNLGAQMGDTIFFHHFLDSYPGTHRDCLLTVSRGELLRQREQIGFSGDRYPEKLPDFVFTELGITLGRPRGHRGAGERGNREGEGLPPGRGVTPVAIRLTFWGVRGSIPTPGPNTVKYGGNTSCLELRFGADDRLVIVDAGSGIRELAGKLLANDLKKGPIRTKIFLTHTHWDHIMGFPFFTPIFIPKTELEVYGPVSFEEDPLEKVVGDQLTYRYFPVRQEELARLHQVLRPQGERAGPRGRPPPQDQVPEPPHPRARLPVRVRGEGALHGLRPRALPERLRRGPRRTRLRCRRR